MKYDLQSACKMHVLDLRQNNTLSKIYPVPEITSLNDTIEKRPRPRDNILMLKCIYSRHIAKHQ